MAQQNTSAQPTNPPAKPDRAAAPTGEVPVPRDARPDTPPPPPKPTRSEKLITGIAGKSLTTSERQVPLEEPPQLPINADLKVVGKRVPRVDARMKVTGAAKYTADVKLPGMLYARMVTSQHPHARVRSIDASAAELFPGVRAVHVLERILGSAVVRDKTKERESKYPIVRYAGQPIAAVAATSQAIADEAARLVRVDYEVLPFVTDLEAARRADAPLVFPGAADQAGTAGGGGGPAGVPQTGNVRGPVTGGPGRRPLGDAAKALTESDAVVDNTFRTQVQTHSALETHGVVADWRGDGLTVYASTQGTVGVRDELAEIFGLPKARVRVISEFMGGGFGAKFGAGNFGVLATQLSKKSGAPVKLMLNRKDEHLSVGNRPDSVQRLRLGARKDGTLHAIHLQMYGTGGVGTGAGTGGPAQNMYECPNVLTEESDVFTHAGPAAAFRAPGHPQGAFALEQSMDMLAERLGMDPLVLRDRNDKNEARREERRVGKQKINWAKRHAPGADKGPVKRGLGAAQSVWYRIINLDSAVEVRIDRDGSVEVLSAVQDIGTGIRTVLGQVVAEELGLGIESVIVRVGDTNFPIGPQSGGSMTTGSISPSARNAAWMVKKQLFERAAHSMGVNPGDLDLAGGRLIVKGDPARSLSFKEAAATIGTDQISARGNRSEDYGARPFAPKQRAGLGMERYGGVQFAEVAVDTETGVIKVERVVAVHDCGRPMNLLTLESQINGGIIQGVSYALFEERILDKHRGLMVNPNLDQYKIAGSRETPQIDVILLEEYIGRSSTDAGGIGEPSTIPTAAAIANAVYNAIGVRMLELPMTPARVLAALGSGRKA